MFVFCLAEEPCKEEPDSFIYEQKPTLKQLSMLQLFERSWPYSDYQSLSYSSLPTGSSSIQLVFSDRLKGMHSGVIRWHNVYNRGS